ncbi:MAG: hypothetical protein ACI8SE_000756 [Bacteroidia bacterium]|jgi:hypothetical protein
MGSSVEVGQVNISQTTYDLLKDDADFTFESRGKTEAKDKGEVEMYFVKLRLGEAGRAKVDFVSVNSENGYGVYPLIALTSFYVLLFKKS